MLITQLVLKSLICRAKMSHAGNRLAWLNVGDAQSTNVCSRMLGRLHRSVEMMDILGEVWPGPAVAPTELFSGTAP